MALQRFSKSSFQGSARVSRKTVCSVRAASSSNTQKRVLITGGNTGIGFETAKVLCGKGYEVVLACRDEGRAKAAVDKIKQEQSSALISSVYCDLGQQATIKDCANKLLDDGKPFDVVLNNAGVMATPKMQTKDGYEFQLGINHLGHWTLTQMLLPSLIEAKKPVRIINVASMAHLNGSINFDDLYRDKPGAYAPWEAYGQSKLSNVMFTYEMARQLSSHPQITVNCLHPGIVRTELGRYMLEDKDQWYIKPLMPLFYLFTITPPQGAETSIYLASSPEVANISSKYFDKCKPITSSPASYDAGVARKLWEVSAEITGVQASIPSLVKA